jgi:phosphoadenosine phosphosulfate reductase
VKSQGASDTSQVSDPSHVGELVARAKAVIADALAAGSLPCITNSFQAEDMVLTHLVREQRADVPVLFLDTFHHFAQTIEYRDEMVNQWGLNLIVLKAPEPQVGLWQQDTKACCDRHKVGPLFTALANYDTWFAGLRRDQSPSRANTQENEPFSIGSKTIRRVSPLAAWTTRDVWRYAKAHDIKLLPLYDLGYTSIGCEPCTSLPDDPNNPRSGRWGGQKLECGIHIQAK